MVNPLAWPSDWIAGGWIANASALSSPMNVPIAWPTSASAELSAAPRSLQSVSGVNMIALFWP